MVNRTKVERQLELIKEYLDFLQEIQLLPEEEFTASRRDFHSAERCLQLAIECLINIGNHIISDQGWRAPQDYADIFMVLSENNILSTEDVLTLKQMVQFRNRLVHVYWDIEPKVLWQIIKEELGDIKQCAQNLAGYTQNH
ncbi:MAG: DUF86 domain-containing protein [Desulfosporosinus sp.]|nr:DUF86 domain-containing protein [Desulfosporosinus sp.]